MSITVPISIGEFVDKLSILKIKLDCLKDSKKRKNVLNEYCLLNDFFEKEHLQGYEELIKINSEIWNLLEEQNELIKLNILNEKFVYISKKIVELNKKRFEVKQKLNNEYSSEIVEEKQYA